jgi:L-lactate dehydrogenase (cytochrome)
MLSRARVAGFTAVILTVDLPVHGNRLRDVRNGFTIPPKLGVRQA